MIRKSIKLEIKEYFFINPSEKLRVRQIERKVKVALPSAINYTKELTKEGIIKSIIIADIKVFTADRTSPNYLIQKKLFNISELFSSNLIDFIIKEYSNPLIIVFGSYSIGEDIESSDIDLYIETPSKKILKLDKFEEILQRKVQIFKYKNIHSLKNKHLANNIINGIIMNGHIEVFK